MEEDKKDFSEYTENIKSETKDTVNQVKNSFKGTNFKDNTKETKNFVFEMFRNPFSKIDEIVDMESNKNFTIALIIVIISVLSIFIENFNSIGIGFKALFSGILSPIFYVLVPSIIMLICIKENKRKLTTFISAFSAAYIVFAIYNVISILNLFTFNIGIITYTLYFLAMAFYFLMSYRIVSKLAYDESKAVKLYTIIMAILGLILYIF